MRSMNPYKALSVSQPWAWLLAHQAEYAPPKTIENRKWFPSYRGPLLIHAPKVLDAETINEMTALWMTGKLPAHWQEAWFVMPERVVDFQTGGIVGVAELVDVLRYSENPWYKCGQFGLVIKKARPLPFIKMRGQLGLFDVEDEIAAQVDALLVGSG